MLGTKKFLDKIKDLFFFDKTHEEVPEAKILAPDPAKILDAVVSFYEITIDDLYRSRRGYFNEPRNVTVYLMRRLRSDTLKAAGDVVRINKNSTVSSIIR